MPGIQSSKLFIALLVVFLLTACSHLNVDEGVTETAAPEPVEPAGWQQLKKQRETINSWELRGRLGVQTAETGGSLDINWRQDGDEYVIRLLAPMGQGSYLVSGDMHSATLRTPDGQTRIIHNPDTLFESSLGVALPLSALHDWVRGLPAASLPLDKIRWDDKGMPYLLDQDGWHIEMTSNIGVEIPLPHKIYLSREDRPELDIRLVLRQWMIDNPVEKN